MSHEIGIVSKIRNLFVHGSAHYPDPDEYVLSPSFKPDFLIVASASRMTLLTMQMMAYIGLMLSGYDPDKYVGIESYEADQIGMEYSDLLMHSHLNADWLEEAFNLEGRYRY